MEIFFLQDTENVCSNEEKEEDSEIMIEEEINKTETVEKHYCKIVWNRK